jgi:type I restriction enzyme S subunit
MMSNKNEFPKDWTTKRFDKISHIVRGGSPRPAGDPRYFNGSYMPWLTVASLTNIPDAQIEVFHTEGFLTEEGAKQSRQLEKGTLILSNSGATLGVAKLLGIQCCANDGIAAFIHWKENEVDKFYACYFLNTKTKYFRDVVAPGNGQPNLNTDLIGIEYIHYPPLPEQKAIAQVLNAADAAIQTTEKLIAQKELRKKWLIQQLLTGKKRLKGFDGEWKEHSYEKILKVVKRNFDWNENELYKLISVRRRSGGIFYREALYGNQILVKTLRTANEGDFLFSKMQILHGASALVPKKFDGAKISGSYIAVVPQDKNTLDMEFFQWYSQTPYFYHQTYISSYGVHIEKMTFDFDTFLQLEMKLPSVEEQTAISKVLQAADKEISLLKAKAEKLREQKKWLMQVLLTGKVRLKINE